MHQSFSRRSAGLAGGALALLLTAAVGARAQDPYGPRPSSAPSPARDLSRVTPLLGVLDGTPRYQLSPATSTSHNDAQLSQMLAFSLQDDLPVDAGRSSPLTTGEHGGMPVFWHYLVKFWETWPNAKERPGFTARLGVVEAGTAYGSSQAPPPPAIRSVLDAQADRFRDAVLAYPFIQRSADTIVRTSITYHKDRDASGTEVWGYRLRIGFGLLGSATDEPRQRPDGRWESNAFDWNTVEVCANCSKDLTSPSGRYRGLQTQGHKVLVDTLEKPLWVSEYRTGEGPLIPDPELYDPARPVTDIQVLLVDNPVRLVGVAANMAPDNAAARAIAATWLTDWKRLVDEGNGPAAPRAD